MNFVDTAIGDADIILYVTDTVEKADKNTEYVEKLQKIECPVILVVNKIDISSQEDVLRLMEWWKEQLPKALIIPASAQEKFNLENIFDAIVERLPQAPAWFDKDAFTDKNLRFFASEIIREKILLYYDKEIPYSVEVRCDSFKETERNIHITATIYVERDSQKGIIIGHQGVAIKKVSTEARKALEKFFGKSIYLETYVKVDKDWRSNDRELNAFGYNPS